MAGMSRPHASQPCHFSTSAYLLNVGGAAIPASIAVCSVRASAFKITEATMAQRKIDTGTNDFLATIEDGVATLTMNRPERRNALSGGMLSAMAATLAECESDPDVAVIVLTGAGGAFCAGGDVKGMADGTGGGSTARAGSDIDSRIHAQRLSQRGTAGKLYKIPKPTIAA